MLSDRAELEKLNLLIDDVQYTFVKPLGNRGQTAVAGFYRDPDNHVFVIKEDPIEVSLLESSAGFLRKYLPEGHENAVNFAEFAWATKSNAQSVAASKQLQIKADRWDPLIFGRDRPAKTPISIEYFYSRRLQSHLVKLSHSAKSDLAAGLFASSLAGDESAHTAQFMAVYDKENKKIIRLIRIDIGARERFALTRALTNDVEAKTSNAYAKSSFQVGKNYLDLLLQNPDVNAKYLRLLLSIKNPHKLGQEGAACFFAALAKLPEESRKEALQKVARVYSKNNEALVAKMSDEKIRQMITMCISHRAEALQRSAKKTIDTALEQFNKMFPLETPHLKFVLAPEEKKTKRIQQPRCLEKEEKRIKSKQPEEVPIEPTDDVTDDFQKSREAPIEPRKLVTSESINKAIFEMTTIYGKFIGNGASKKKIKLYNEVLSHLYAAIEFSHLPLNETKNQRKLIEHLQEKVRDQQKGCGNWIQNHRKKIIIGALIGVFAIGTVLTLGAAGLIGGGMFGGFVWLGTQLTLGAASAPVAVSIGTAATGVGAPLICLPTFSAVKSVFKKGIQCISNCFKSFKRKKEESDSENNKHTETDDMMRRYSSTARINIFPEKSSATNKPSRQSSVDDKSKPLTRALLPRRTLSLNNDDADLALGRRDSLLQN